MKETALALMVVALVAWAARAEFEVLEPERVWNGGREAWCWFDDLEPPDPGWTHGDLTEGTQPHFHVDTYMAYSGSYSWWCGTFDYDADGGYGNRWTDRLEIPPVDWTGYTYAVLMFYYRNDSEYAYDFTYVEAESNGVFVRLNTGGYDGVTPWQWDGFYLADKDNPSVCRFRFESDAYWSDEDGLYESSGGAFMCDEIEIMDYYTGTVLFYDDCESGGLCTPVGLDEPAGDYWHTVSNPCKAWSDPTVWVNTQIDTPGYVPPRVQNWLMTPMVDISCATTCTVRHVVQRFTPNVGRARASACADLDGCIESVTVDGGLTWTMLRCWPYAGLGGEWSDQCDAGSLPCDHSLVSDDITWLLPGTLLAYRWVYYSSYNGAGPNSCGNAGLTIDDVGFYGAGCPCESAVEETSWGRVKSLFR
jgi:hypothetical protein